MAAAPVPEDDLAADVGEDDADYVLGEIHDVRAEVVRLDGVLRDIAAAAAKGRAALRAALEDDARLQRPPDAATLAARVDRVQQSSRSLKAQRGDELRHMVNALLDAADHWPSAEAPERAAEQVALASADLSRALVQAARITLPERLRGHLRQMHIGETLHFEREFADELPQPAQRAELLGWLARHPLAVSGVVDVEKGVIWRASERTWIRALTWLAPLATVAAVAGALWLLTIPGGGWPFADDAKDLCVGFLVAMLGVAAHFIVSVVKHRQAADPGGAYAAGRWLLWLHVNWLSLSVQVLSPLVVTVGMVLIGAQLDSAQDYATFFLAGYGADSLAAVFVARLEVAAATAAKTLQAQAGA
jgi:hypothetical protein